MKIKRKKTRNEAPAAPATSKKPPRSIQRVIGPATIPYTFWKQWNKARLRGEMELMFDMTHPDGPFRSRIGTSTEAFIEYARSNNLPLGPDWYLAKIKISDSVAHLLSCRGLDDPGTRTLDLELLTLHRVREGWRIFDVTALRKSKDKGQETFFGFDDFGIASADAALHKRVSEGFVRPDLADRPASKAPEITADEADALAKLAAVFGKAPETSDDSAA